MSAGMRGEQAQAAVRPLAEWVSFGVAATVLIVVAGLVVYLWLAAPATPPVVSVAQSGPVRRVGAIFYVPFEVTNSGGDTADAVTVRAELHMGGELVEDGDLEFDFLAGGESEEGAFVFTRDPAQGELRLRVGGYRLP